MCTLFDVYLVQLNICNDFLRSNIKMESPDVVLGVSVLNFIREQRIISRAVLELHISLSSQALYVQTSFLALLVTIESISCYYVRMRTIR